MDVAGLQFKDRDRHVGDVMLPDEDEIAAAEIVAVLEEVGCPVLGLSEELLALPLQHVVGERRAALEYPVPETTCLLREELADADLILGLER
jgi:hypothetical protein